MFDNDLIHGLIATIAVQAILYLSQRITTLSEFMSSFFGRAKSMANMAIIAFFAFMLSAANTEMGVFEFLIGGLVKTVSPQLLPALIFVSSGPGYLCDSRILGDAGNHHTDLHTHWL